VRWQASKYSSLGKEPPVIGDIVDLLPNHPLSDLRAALALLAGSPNVATETIMLAHEFSIDFMVELVTAALATAHAQRMVARIR